MEPVEASAVVAGLAAFHTPVTNDGADHYRQIELATSDECPSWVLAVL